MSKTNKNGPGFPACFGLWREMGKKKIVPETDCLCCDNKYILLKCIYGYIKSNYMMKSNQGMRVEQYRFTEENENGLLIVG